MILKEMIVTDADGKTKTVAEDLTGTCIKSDDVYSFYAIKNVNPPASKPPADQKAVKVRIVMPVGGEANGLYRFPRVGEKVLIGIEGTSHYLMGYLSTKEKPFSSTTDEFDDEGLVLRYKKTGKNASKNGYSEISFKRKDTKWPTSDSSLQKESYSKVVTDDNDKKTYYPYVDRLDISSTGDIVSKAKNFNELDGERVLIQSKFLTSSNIAVDKKKDETNGKDNTTVKEMTVKEKDIGKGDLILSADRRILLNAREGFAVQVGGCTFSVTSSGITMKAGKLDGAKAGEGPFDATLSLSVKGGVDITGQTMSGGFDRSVSLSDAFGGAIDLETGMASVNGTSVSLGAMTTLSAIDKSVVGLASLLAQIISVPLSANLDYKAGSAAEASAQIKMINSLIGGIFKYPDLSQKAIKGPDSSTLDTIIKVVKIIYKVFDKVRNVLIKEFDSLSRLHYDTKTKKYYNDDRREACLTACAVVDATLQSAIVGMLLGAAKDAIVHQATIDLTSNAAVSIDSKDFYQDSISHQHLNSPVSGLNPPDAADDEEEDGEGGDGDGSFSAKEIAAKGFKRHTGDVVSFIMSEFGMYATFEKPITEDTQKALGEL